MKCSDCGKVVSTSTIIDGQTVCTECSKKRRQANIIAKSASVKMASDFKSWKGHELSDLFWIHLGKYTKAPNEESWRFIRMALLWACHADHGLSSSFHHALTWAGLDLYTETERWKNGG